MILINTITDIASTCKQRGEIYKKKKVILMF